jgi:MFS family permease
MARNSRERPGPHGRTTVALLRDRTFGPFTIGKIFSACGNWVQTIAAAVLMYDLTGSALMVGSVSVVLFAGPLLLALWTGQLTDRRDRRLVLIAGRTISAVSVGLLAVALLVAGIHGFGGPGVLLAFAAVMSIGNALTGPAMHAITPGLVPDEDLEPALALASVAPSLARTVGPAAGAGLIVLGGPGLAFAVAAATHAAFVAVLLVIRARPRQRGADGPGLLGGVRYLISQRSSGLLVIAMAMLAFGADPVITLAPSMADRLGGGSELVGVFASAFGSGAVLIALTFRQLRRLASLRHLGVAGFVGLAAGLVGVALAPSANGVTGGFAVAGAGFMLGAIALQTRVQRRVPDELRGRVMAMWGVATLGSRPLAAPINGAIADHVSVTAALLFAAGVVLSASLLARVRTGDVLQTRGPRQCVRYVSS